MNEDTTNSLDGFVDLILLEKGASSLPEEVQGEMKKDLLARLENRINVALLVAIPPEQLENFEATLDTGDSEKIQEFCKKYVSNMEEIVGGELASFKVAYLSA